MMGFAPNLPQNHFIGSGQTNFNSGFQAVPQYSYPSGNPQNEVATTRIIEQSFTPAIGVPASFSYAPEIGVRGVQQNFQPNMFATQSFSPSFKPGPQYSWVLSNASSISERAFAGGRDMDGETLYVGRADFRNSLTPGK